MDYAINAKQDISNQDINAMKTNIKMIDAIY